MKAQVLESKASPFVLKDVPMPIVNAGDVLVRLKASAMNHRDLYIRQGTYPRTNYPIIIGSDGSGVVEDVAASVSRSLIGSSVVINPGHNWGTNPNAQQREFKILGLPDNGTLAEYIAVPAKYILPKPEYMSFEEASALMLVGVTAYRALFTRGSVQRGESVLITGIGGGVALTALQFALAAEAKVFVTSGSDAKIEKAMLLGAAGGVNYKSAPWAIDLAKLSNGFDLIVDGAAGAEFGKLLDVASPGGRVVVYGSVQGKIQNAEAARIYWKQLSILGSTMGTEEECAAMLAFAEAHRVKPIIDSVFRFEDADAAMKRMESGEQFGKIVLRNDQ
ncbi:MAG: zinc-binding dehydrogenase [Ignavibacteriae bacterium]|nr:zinc-binding dehydrogenase [Ignavibacteriota bacterium]